MTDTRLSPDSRLSPNFTDEQLAWVVASRASGMTFQEISDAYPKKYKRSRLAPNAEVIRGLFRRHAASLLDSAASKEARARHPFRDFTREGIGRRVGKNTKKKATFFVMAVSPVNLHSPFRAGFDEELGVRSNLFDLGFQAALNFCKARNAQLVLLASKAHLPPSTREVQHYDPTLWPYRDRLFTEFVFNENLRARDLYILPQSPRPLTGLWRLRGKDVSLQEELQRDKDARTIRASLLIASPKQDMESIPTGNASLARLLQGTGSGTLPEYLGNRIGSIAEEDHVLGGVIVEVDGPLFWPHKVQFGEDGSFCDYHGAACTGIRYFPDRVPAKERGLVWTPGDRHVGWNHAGVDAAWEKVMRDTQPAYTILDDIFDGASHAWQLDGKALEQLALPETFRSLQAELDAARAWLSEICALVKPWDGQIVIRFSNHHEKIKGYLNSGRFLREKENLRAAARILHKHVEDIASGRDQHPLQDELDPEGLCRWLGPNEDFVVDGVNYGAHGHLGPNGARGSLQNMEKTFGHAVIGHGHSPGSKNGTDMAGHSSAERHGYNSGPSGWLHAGVLHFRGIGRPGQRMHIVCVKGRHHG